MMLQPNRARYIEMIMHIRCHPTVHLDLQVIPFACDAIGVPIVPTKP